MKKIAALWFLALALVAACSPTPTATVSIPPTAIATEIPTTVPTMIVASTVNVPASPTFTATASALPQSVATSELVRTATATVTFSPTLFEPPSTTVVVATATTVPPTTIVPPTVTQTPSLTRAVVAAPTNKPTQKPPPQNPQVARGAQLFVTMKCTSCHIKPARGQRIAPDLAHIATDAEQIIRLPDYHGGATDVPSFLYESITNPNAYVQPPFGNLTVDGSSLMPKDFAQKMSAKQIQDLIAYLLTLR